MSGSSTEAPSRHPSMDTYSTEDCVSGSIRTAGSSSSPSQNNSDVSTSRIHAMHQFSCNLPLDQSGDNILNYLLHQQGVDANSEGAPSNENYSFWARGLHGNPPDQNTTYENHIGEDSMDEDSMEKMPMPFTSPQVYESYSGSYPNISTPNSESSILALLMPHDPRDHPQFQYSTLTRSQKASGPTQPSDNNGSGRRRRLANSRTPGSASPKVDHSNSRVYPNDSDGNSDTKVTKAKKIHQCAECRKKFGRSAELKRHRKSVHENEVLLECHHEGCGRVGDFGFKRKDNLVQHLRGVHGDVIEKKGGCGTSSTGTSPAPSIPNAGAGSPATAIGNDNILRGQQQDRFTYVSPQQESFPHMGQQQELFPYMGQQQTMQEGESESLSFLMEFYQSLGTWPEEEQEEGEGEIKFHK